MQCALIKMTTKGDEDLHKATIIVTIEQTVAGRKNYCII